MFLSPFHCSFVKWCNASDICNSNEHDDHLSINFFLQNACYVIARNASIYYFHFNWYMPYKLREKLLVQFHIYLDCYFIFYVFRRFKHWAWWQFDRPVCSLSMLFHHINILRFHVANYRTTILRIKTLHTFLYTSSIFGAVIRSYAAIVVISIFKCTNSIFKIDKSI